MIIKCNKYWKFDRYSIGNSDLINGVEYGWLYTLSKQTKHPYTMVQKFIGNSSMPYHIELANGPDTRARYVILADCSYFMILKFSISFGIQFKEYFFFEGT